MYPANIQQLFKKNPFGVVYSNWVLFTRLRADTAIENVIRSKHEEIETSLNDQNVSYAEITTNTGRKHLYDKFNCHERNHPLFFIFNKYPADCQKKDHCIIVEWGIWEEAETLRNDLMALVTFFSHKEFRERIQNAHKKKVWSTIKKSLPKIFEASISVLSAVL
ncbi:MAG: hypothetical protein KAT34_20945 [Candidatus Aminicenantes bacterium]|nr:hypothetical protein [Candidatus Aminicenantes bacterium]